MLTSARGLKLDGEGEGPPKRRQQKNAVLMREFVRGKDGIIWRLKGSVGARAVQWKLLQKNKIEMTEVMSFAMKNPISNRYIQWENCGENLKNIKKRIF